MRKLFFVTLITGCIAVSSSVTAQILTLNQAVQTALNNYESIQAKRNYMYASAALVKNTRNEYLPTLTGSVQQDYGTINGQFGALSGFGGIAVASAGPVYPTQNWNAAFGALYIVNTDWEFFAFGRLRSKINVAKYNMYVDSADLAQEQFIHSVRVSGAYLNLLVAQEFVRNAQANLSRAVYVQQSVVARASSGLNAGVDSSIANAEVSAAKVSLLEATEKELEQSNLLAQYMNVAPANFVLDTSYFAAVPANLNTTATVKQNPQVRYYQARVDASDIYTAFLKRSILPGLNLFGTFQDRASGFNADYIPGINNDYSTGYTNGVNPTRANYLVGVGIAWNLLSPASIKQRVNAQKFITAAYQNEADIITTQLQDQLVLADQRIDNSLKTVHEVPIEYHAALDAYNQKNELYKSGLTTIVDLQQAMYALNQAETDMSVAYINAWQALLLKSGASGDFDLFIKQVK